MIVSIILACRTADGTQIREEGSPSTTTEKSLSWSKYCIQSKIFLLIPWCFSFDRGHSIERSQKSSKIELRCSPVVSALACSLQVRMGYDSVDLFLKKTYCVSLSILSQPMCCFVLLCIIYCSQLQMLVRDIRPIVG